jgi:hypothetical protein
MDRRTKEAGILDKSPHKWTKNEIIKKYVLYPKTGTEQV